MGTAILAGAAAGFMLFLLQWALVTPLIRRAEAFQRLGPWSVVAAHHAAAAWEPADGAERVAYTAVGTVLTGIGFSAVLLGLASLLGLDLDARRGLRLGLCGFVCVALAPALGLPPKPPGVAVPDLEAAQLWWVLTVVLSSAGLWLLLAPRGSTLVRGAGALTMAIPHLLGAPAATASTLVPRDLTWRFAATAIGTQALFWLMLGTLGGWMQTRHGAEHPSRRRGGVDRAA